MSGGQEARAIDSAARRSIIVRMNLKIVLEPSEDGGFTVYVPALRGCISEGDTREQALTNIREAIELYLDIRGNEISISDEAEVEDLVV